MTRPLLLFIAIGSLSACAVSPEPAEPAAEPESAEEVTEGGGEFEGNKEFSWRFTLTDIEGSALGSARAAELEIEIRYPDNASEGTLKLSTVIRR